MADAYGRPRCVVQDGAEVVTRLCDLHRGIVEGEGKVEYAPFI